MIPVLFGASETVFATQGIGALTDAISCKVQEERNGVYELEMQYPVNGIHYEDVKERAIICAIPSPYRKRQPFRIYKITKPLNGIVKIYASHLSYDLSAIPVNPFSAVGITQTLAILKNSMEIENNFLFYSGITNETSSVEISTPTACRSVLGGIRGSLLDVFGGEYEWDDWKVTLWADRGHDNGITIRYGKNMTALSCETDVENVVTGIYPYWQKEDVLVTCTPKIIWAANIGYQKALPVDFTNDFDEQPTPAQLKARAEKYITDNKIGNVPISINVSFVQLAQMSGYEDLAILEKCDLCDTVTVQHEALGVDVKAKIVGITTNVLLERYESVKVGTVQADIAQTITDTSNKVDAVVRPDGSLIAESLRGFIDGSLVNLYAQYSAAKPAGVLAVLFENNDTASPLYGALAIGTQGLLIAKQKKTDGTGWDWTTAITASGGMLGHTITGKISNKDGTSWWDLDNGGMQMTGTFRTQAQNGEYTEMSPGGLVHYENTQKEYYCYMTHVGSVTFDSFTWDEEGGFLNGSYATAEVQLPERFKGRNIVVTPYLQGMKTRNPKEGEYMFIYDCMTKLGTSITDLDTANAKFTLRVDIGVMCPGGKTVSGAIVATYATQPENVIVGYTAIA